MLFVLIVGLIYDELILSLIEILLCYDEDSIWFYVMVVMWKLLSLCQWDQINLDPLIWRPIDSTPRSGVHNQPLLYGRT